MGAILYSDDQLLIIPNRRAMELMLAEVEKFTKNRTSSFRPILILSSPNRN
jgi:hypothetical protein